MKFTRCFRCMQDTAGYPCSNCGYSPESSPAQSYALRPGTILKGKYVVGIPLGQGGFGITYIGWDLASERKVAIKEYFPSGQVSRNIATGNVLQWYTTDQAHFAKSTGMETFQKEARKMERVADIPQVVNVLEVFEENATAYIVMDYIEGETLKKRLEKTGPMSWEQAKEIFLPVVSAMVQVHQAGLIHRDLSPDNLMLQPDGGVRILDLGAAKDLNINTGASSMQVAKGGFSPLEQYTQRGGSGTWTDVYSLAATMYYTITGVLPPAAVDRVSGDLLRWDLPQLATLPKNVLEALQRAMVLLQDKRTRTMEEFSRQLTKGTEAPPVPPNPQKIRKWMIPAAAVAVVAAAVLLFGMQSGAGTKETVQESRNTVSSGTEPRTSGTKPWTSGNHPSDFDNDVEYAALVASGTDDIYTYANGAKVELYFEDELECCRIFTNQDGQRDLIFTAVYDGDGNMTEQRMYDGDGQLQRLDVNDYNADGNKTAALIFDGSNTLLLSSIWTYDRQGRELSFEQKNGSGNVLRTGSSTYDADGAETYTWQANDGRSGCNQYDKDGNCLFYFGYTANGEEDYHGEFSYDSEGRETEFRYYDCQNKLITRSESQYVGDKLILEIEYDYYGDSESDRTKDMLYGPHDICFGCETKSSYSNSIDEYVESIDGTLLRSFSTALEESKYATNDVSYFNWMGECISTERYRLDGSLSSRDEYRIDPDSVELGHANTFYSDDTFTVTDYDTDNRPLLSATYNIDGSPVSRTEYEYKGNQIREKSYDADGTMTRSSEQMNNDNGDELWEKNYNTDGSLSSEAEYHYDDGGILTGYVYTSYSSYDDTHTITEYDADNNPLSSNTYHANGSRERWTEYQYDGNGNMLREKSYDAKGSLTSESEYYYDADGTRAGYSYTSYSSYDNTRTVTEYDADSNPLSRNTYNANGSRERWTEYEYDGNRRWARDYDADCTLTSWMERLDNDNGDELWEKYYDGDGTLTSEYEYHYDANGIRTGHTYTYYSRWNKTKTVTEYDASWNQVSKKTYDANGKLIESE